MTEADPGNRADVAVTDSAEASDDWAPPRITIKWPNYLKRDATDEQLTVQTTTAAYTAGLITQRRAVEKLMQIFGIEAIDAELDALEEESADKQQKAVENAKAMAEAVPPKPAPGQPQMVAKTAAKPFGGKPPTEKS